MSKEKLERNSRPSLTMKTKLFMASIIAAPTIAAGVMGGIAGEHAPVIAPPHTTASQRKDIHTADARMNVVTQASFGFALGVAAAALLFDTAPSSEDESRKDNTSPVLLDEASSAA